jgi:hypothetical protein
LLNGVPVAKNSIGVPIAVEPGVMLIEAGGPGGRAARRRIVIGAGETKTVALSFAVDPEEAGGNLAKREENTLVPRPSERALFTMGPRAAPNPGARSAPEGPTLVRALGFGAVGVGVAGIIVFGVAGSMAESNFRALKKECGGARCTDLKYTSAVDQGKMLDAVANTGLAVGVAGLVAGGVMIVLGAPSPSKKTSAAAIGISPYGAGLRYSRSF